MNYSDRIKPSLDVDVGKNGLEPGICHLFETRLRAMNAPRPKVCFDPLRVRVHIVHEHPATKQARTLTPRGDGVVRCVAG